MNKAIRINRHFLSLSIPILLFASVILLIKSPFFQTESNALTIAVSIDLILTIPLIYFLIIRKTKIPKTTVIPILILGLVVGSYVLPENNQTYLDFFKLWILPFLEITLFTFLIIKVRRARIEYKKNKNHTNDFFTALKNACFETLPRKAAFPFATEIAVIYYSFFNWNQREFLDNEYTYHNKSGTPNVMYAFIAIIIVETYVAHILLIRWNEIAAWIFFGISIYTVFQVYGFAKSLSKRPIVITEDKLILRYGIMSETEISYCDIYSIELSKKEIKQDKLIRKLSPFGNIEAHNVIISLKTKNTLTGIYGIKRQYKTLALHIDNEVKFREAIDLKL